MHDNDKPNGIRWQADKLAETLLGPGRVFENIARFPGDVDIEIYAPLGEDRQQPHDRDELYFVVRGSGTFRRGDERISFAAGDMLFVGAHVPHRFESFTDDFLTWVVFFGPVKKPAES